ncbi:MAG TPA: response regulator transcription factor [Candidatus Acidoferrum sp.]|nr:response regulator transcription factor [Candidatus Acidoferrum sp.]
MQTTNDKQSSSSTNAYVLAEHRLLRETLVRLLRKRADICVVGESRHIESTSELIIASNCQVLLLDSLTAPHAAKLLDDLHEKAPKIKIVLFGMDEDPQTFLKAVRFGVSGYVVKDASAAEIIAAVRAVAQGEAVCPPKLCMTLFQHVAREFRKQPVVTDRDARIKFGITHRQSQLVALVARGLSNKEIAASLNVSEFTVKSHLRRIMKQVNAESRFEAVDMMRASGFIPSA